MNRPRSIALAILTAMALALPLPAAASPSAGSTAPDPPGAFTPGSLALTFTPIGTFTKPVLVTHAGDGSGRLFVVEQVGRIRVVRSDGSIGTFLDIRSAVSRGGEQGLLGLAFHPGYASNGRFFVNYTNTAGDTIIREYGVSSDPDRASGTPVRTILRIDQPYANHNGGHVAFGPDGLLYIGMGDGGSAGDPGNRAQNLESLLGKMLRINVDRRTSTRNYTIPSGNPYVGRAGRDEIWSRGLRNPWRWSFDRSTGALWIADVGQGRYEEVNRSPATSSGAGRGANYGWRVMEGRHCYRPSSGCNTSGKVRPLIEYAHGSTSRCAVTGGHVYRGSASPAMAGGYFYGDYCTGEIWAIAANASPSTTPTRIANTELLIASFGEDEAGELYVADLSGSVYRLAGS